jgi:hypothetical protein
MMALGMMVAFPDLRPITAGLGMEIVSCRLTLSR